MKIALIPPAGYEEYAFFSNMHMVLGPEIVRANYAQTYVHPRDQLGFVILDNGANEGNPMDPTELAALARKLRPSELILPDTLGDMTSTVFKSAQFIGSKNTYDGTKYMIVLQGKNTDEFLGLLDFATGRERITTVGIPRHLPVTCGRPKSWRIDLANMVNDKYADRFKIHFLGGVTGWPTEVSAIAKYAPFVRSLDTSAPFNYAIAGRFIGEKGLHDNIVRPAGYFIKRYDIDLTLLHLNIREMLNWCNASQ